MSEFGSEISLEALNHMEVLQRNITEALRINPPLTLLLRQVKKSFAVTTSSGKTHIVPKVQMSSASVIHGGSKQQDRSWLSASALHSKQLCVKMCYSVTHISASVLICISAIVEKPLCTIMAMHWVASDKHSIIFSHCLAKLSSYDPIWVLQEATMIACRVI